MNKTSIILTSLLAWGSVANAETTPLQNGAFCGFRLSGATFSTSCAMSVVDIYKHDNGEQTLLVDDEITEHGPEYSYTNRESYFFRRDISGNITLLGGGGYHFNFGNNAIKRILKSEGRRVIFVSSYSGNEIKSVSFDPSETSYNIIQRLNLSSSPNEVFLADSIHDSGSDTIVAISKENTFWNSPLKVRIIRASDLTVIHTFTPNISFFNHYGRITSIKQDPEEPRDFYISMDQINGQVRIAAIRVNNLASSSLAVAGISNQIYAMQAGSTIKLVLKQSELGPHATPRKMLVVFRANLQCLFTLQPTTGQTFLLDHPQNVCNSSTAQYLQPYQIGGNTLYLRGYNATTDARTGAEQVHLRDIPVQVIRDGKGYTVSGPVSNHYNSVQSLLYYMNWLLQRNSLRDLIQLVFSGGAITNRALLTEINLQDGEF